MDGNLENLLRSMFSKNTLQIDYLGRTIHISTKSSFNNLNKHTTAWDIESGTSVGVDHSDDGSKEAARKAVQKLICELQEKGVITNITSHDEQHVALSSAAHLTSPSFVPVPATLPNVALSSATPLTSPTIIAPAPVPLQNVASSSLAAPLTSPTVAPVPLTPPPSSATPSTSSSFVPVSVTSSNIAPSSATPSTSPTVAPVPVTSPNVVPSSATPSTSPKVAPVPVTSSNIAPSWVAPSTSSSFVPVSVTSPNIAPSSEATLTSSTLTPVPLKSPPLSATPLTSQKVTPVSVTSPNVDRKVHWCYSITGILGVVVGSVVLFTASFLMLMWLGNFLESYFNDAEVNMKTVSDKLRQGGKNDVLTLQSVNGVNNDDLMRIANAFVNDNGQMQYKGRTIHYSTKGRIHSLSEPWVYDATAWDVESGTSAKVRHFEESEDAAKAAFEKLIVELKQKGILKEQVEETSTSGKDRQEDISQPEHTTQPNQPSNQPPPSTDEVHKEAPKDTNRGLTWGFLQSLNHVTFSEYYDFVLGIFITSCFGIGIYIVIICWKSHPNGQGKVHSNRKYKVDDGTTYHYRHPADNLDDYMDVEPDYKGLYTSIHIQAAKPTPQQLDSKQNYCMWSPVKGLAYILNNSHFPEREQKNQDRHGSHEDFMNMKHLFTELGYKIVPHENLEAKDIRETIKNFVSMFNDTDSCEYVSAVVVLMSHGDTGYICGSDDRNVYLKQIQAEFEGKKCPKLQGKPKLFFIQACRGNLITSSTVADISSDNANPSPHSTEISEVDVATDDNFAKDVPDNADMHFAYATTEGYLSLRNKRDGSWFIQAITEVFLANAHHENLDKLMNMVTDRVTGLKGKLYDPQMRKKVIAQQTPERVTRMRKTLYFLPKYPPTY